MFGSVNLIIEQKKFSSYVFTNRKIGFFFFFFFKRLERFFTVILTLQKSKTTSDCRWNFWYFTLCTYKKHVFFFFSKCFLGCRFQICNPIFFGRLRKSPIIRKKIFFPDYRGFPVSNLKDKTSASVSAGQKALY